MRFSALGDIAMMVPVLRNVLLQNPDLQITVMSVPFVAPLFSNIARLHFYAVDLKRFRGVSGIRRLVNQIKKDLIFDAMADLHNVIRTKLIRFFLSDIRAQSVNKHRTEKRLLTRPRNKIMKPVKPVFEQYAGVFRALGISVELNIAKGLTTVKESSVFGAKQNTERWIGVAPFAKHAMKMYPLEKMLAAVNILSAQGQRRFIFFSSRQERLLLQNFLDVNKFVIQLPASVSFSTELEIISQLDCMVSMDSANMHLASLCGVPVVSVWGSTHPYLGFYGWGQELNNAVQTDLACRPSSVYGNKPCPVHGLDGCMQEITPEMIAEKVTRVLENQHKK